MRQGETRIVHLGALDLIAGRVSSPVRLPAHTGVLWHVEPHERGDCRGDAEVRS